MKYAIIVHTNRLIQLTLNKSTNIRSSDAPLTSTLVRGYFCKGLLAELVLNSTICRHSKLTCTRATPTTICRMTLPSFAWPPRRHCRRIFSRFACGTRIGCPWSMWSTAMALSWAGAWISTTNNRWYWAKRRCLSSRWQPVWPAIGTSSAHFSRITRIVRDSGTVSVIAIFIRCSKMHVE